MPEHRGARAAHGGGDHLRQPAPHVVGAGVPLGGHKRLQATGGRAGLRGIGDTMQLRMKVDEKPVCTIEVWEDKVPQLTEVLKHSLPQKSILQHGKIVGDMVFWTMPIVAPWE